MQVAVEFDLKAQRPAVQEKIEGQNIPASGGRHFLNSTP